MMKYIRIFGFILLYFLCTGKSCDEKSQEAAQKEEQSLQQAIDSVKTEFQADYLPGSSLKAFEENARQKLVSFTDYFRILNDLNLDSSFREQAAGMIRELFYPGKVRLDLSLPGKPALNKIDLDELLKGKALREYNRSELIIDSIRVTDPLHRTGASEYRGILEFTQGFSGISAKDTVIARPQARKMDIIAIKVKRPFGKDTLLIWKILLGDIH